MRDEVTKLRSDWLSSNEDDPHFRRKSAFHYFAGDVWPTVSPLTPALSPLRGEGARRATMVSACRVRERSRRKDAETRSRSLEHASNVRRDSLSPQRGEGWGEG